MPRHFGDIPGIDPGAHFDDRHALRAAGLHLPLQAGISGSGYEGADSIVLSGGYEDDEDLGDVIIYTGHGGNHPISKTQEANQQLQRGNLALARNCAEGLPVRVIRGSRHRSPWSPPVGYEYAGLYRVESFWSEVGKSGYLIWRYRLERIPPGSPVRPGRGVREERPGYDAEDDDDGPAPRQPLMVQRIIRVSALAAEVKRLYGSHCQVCGERVDTIAGPYAEAAHIRPLGAPHDGPDVLANLLCLCPNHHVMYDYGGIVIDATGRVIYVANGAIMGLLRVHPEHGIDPKHLAYHRYLFLGERVDPR